MQALALRQMERIVLPAQGADFNQGTRTKRKLDDNCGTMQ